MATLVHLFVVVEKGEIQVTPRKAGCGSWLVPRVFWAKSQVPKNWVAIRDAKMTSTQSALTVKSLNPNELEHLDGKRPERLSCEPSKNPPKVV